jgi:hypothetical protein
MATVASRRRKDLVALLLEHSADADALNSGRIGRCSVVQVIRDSSCMIWI